MKLNTHNCGLAFSCTNDNNIWGKKEHELAIEFLLNNLDNKIEAYSIKYNNEPAGHAIICNTQIPFSPVIAENSSFLQCIYIREQFRKKDLANILMDFIEDDLQKHSKHALFVETSSYNKSLNTLIKNKNFTIIKENPNIYLKKYIDKITFSIYNPKIPKNTPPNTLIINYIPMCPFTIKNYKNLIYKIKKVIPNIKVIENIIFNEKDIEKYGYVGISFNNIPLYFDNKHINDFIASIKNLII